MKFASLLVFLFALPALAHVEKGRFVGHTADGKACEMISAGMSFENGVHHPLNERVTVTVNGVEFTLRHPPVIDVASSTAYFNHDMFQGINATSDGAIALQIDMVHTPSKEGPVRFTLIENKWKTDEKTSVTCEDIQLVP